MPPISVQEIFLIFLILAKIGMAAWFLSSFSPVGNVKILILEIGNDLPERNNYNTTCVELI